MTDDELDELIVTRLRYRLALFLDGKIGNGYQTPADLALLFNEPETRIEARLSALSTHGKVDQPTTGSGRWIIALSSYQRSRIAFMPDGGIQILPHIKIDPAK